jgi:hypothetical protein
MVVHESGAQITFDNENYIVVASTPDEILSSESVQRA